MIDVLKNIFEMEESTKLKSFEILFGLDVDES